MPSTTSPATVGAYLDEVIPKLESGEADTGRNFPGEAKSGCEPELQIHPGGGDPVDVVVEWSFDLTS